MPKVVAIVLVDLGPRSTNLVSGREAIAAINHLGRARSIGMAVKRMESKVALNPATSAPVNATGPPRIRDIWLEFLLR